MYLLLHKLKISSCGKVQGNRKGMVPQTQQHLAGQTEQIARDSLAAMKCHRMFSILQSSGTANTGKYGWDVNQLIMTKCVLGCKM
jgi:hypothetical protein